MKLKLKENMYVRNCYGRIAKIEYIEDNTAYCDNWLYQSYEDHITFINLDDEDDIDEILKASYNIIDLIEIGDIVITPLGEIIQPYGGNIDELKDYWKITKNPIKSIITKEQMEQMAYKVGE